MDFGFLKNPWVIGGGLGVAVLLLLSRGGSSSSGGDYNKASLDLVAQQSALSADVEKTRITAGAALGAQVVSAITNLVSAKYSLDLGQQQTAAGIAQTRIAANTAKVIEADQVRIRGKEISAGLQTNILEAVYRLMGLKEQDHFHLKMQSNSETSNFLNNIFGKLL